MVVGSDKSAHPLATNDDPFFFQQVKCLTESSAGDTELTSQLGFRRQAITRPELGPTDQVQNPVVCLHVKRTAVELE